MLAMTEPERRPPRIKRAIRLSQDGIDAIQEQADSEDRTWSDMARVLLGEAIEARRKRERRTR